MDRNHRAGLASVTFRQHEYQDVVKHVKIAGLSCIEWGGDVHAPHDAAEKANLIDAEMCANNLVTSSYGSYYRLGADGEPDIFERVMKVAVNLSAPVIRVWGGVCGSRRLSAEGRESIIKDALRVAEKAKQANIKIALEYHQDTITDTVKSALDFMEEARGRGGDNIYLYWQPNQNVQFLANKDALVDICPYLANIHVFAWEGSMRLPLRAHSDRWAGYINIIREHSGAEHDFLLEFVKGDSADQMAEDAEVLAELLDR